MTLNQKEQIAESLVALGIDMDSYSDITKAYINLLFIHNFYSKEADITKTKALTEKATGLYDAPFFNVWDDQIIMNLYRLMELADGFVWENFFGTFASSAVMDREGFNGRKELLIRKMMVLYGILKNFENEKIIPYQSVMEYFKENESAFERIGVKEDAFREIALSVLYKKVKPAIIRKNSAVEDVRKMYSEKKIPRNALLDDIYTCKKPQMITKLLEHQWSDNMNARRMAIYDKNLKEGKKANLPVELESGLSKEEVLFITGASQLKYVKATDIIASLFYDIKRNDYAFERDVLTERFFFHVNEQDKIMVINPCPQMVEEYEGYRWKGIFKDLYFVVNDTTIANLYMNQYGNDKYCTFRDTDYPQVDKILIIARDYARKDIKELFSPLEKISKSAFIMAFINNSAFPVANDYVAGKVYPTQLIKVNSDLVGSSPKEKSIIVYAPIEKEEGTEAEGTKKKNKIAVNEIVSVLVEGERYYYSNKHDKKISMEEYYANCTELLKFENSILHPSKPVVITRPENPSKEYNFSKEIKINYLLLNRKNTLAARAYYKSIKKENRANHGKRISPYIEGGLRTKSNDELMEALENLPFREELYQIIYEDIRENLIETNRRVSFKTIWFMLHEDISAVNGYKESTAKEIFMSQKREIEDLDVYEATEEDYKTLFKTVFSDESEENINRFMKQINIILNFAIKNNYDIKNPLSKLLAEQIDRVLEEQKNVRNKLLKRVLTEKEMRTLLEYICKLQRKDEKDLKLYQTDSVVLAAGIKLFTGIATKEIISLSWCDITRINPLGFDEIIITKFLDREGTIKTNIEANDWMKFRRVPLMDILTFMLNERKKYLKDTYHLTEKEISTHPIVVMSDEDYSNEDLNVPRRCSLSKLTEGLRKVMNHAGIAEKTIIFPDEDRENTTDLSKNQNIYYSNFKHQVNHVALLTQGEINYILGISPPTTFSKHYCDYSNDVIQYRMHVKLNRWGNTYADIIKTRKRHQLNSGTLVTDSFETGNDYGKKTMLDLFIESTDAEFLTIDNEHGYNITITDYDN